MLNSSPLISVNGVVGQQISPLDRGFAYGDGLFETCRILQGRLPLWELHLARLAAGCEQLRLGFDRAQVERYRDDLWQQSNPAGGIFKLTLTRGAGGRGYLFPADSSPTVCMGIYQAPPVNPHWQGVTLRVCQHRLASNPVLAGVKHLNRLEQVLARNEWQDPAIADGLMLDYQGQVIETTSSNIFCYQQGELLTPVLDQCGVAGVMRAFICNKLAPSLGIPVRETRLDLAQLLRADELMICNAVHGIWPVLSVVGTDFSRPAVGRIARLLQEALLVEFPLESI